MKTRHIHGVEVQESSGNVFADLGVADAEKLKIKTGLVIQIKKAMREQALTQQEAAKRMGITQPKVSDMMRGVEAHDAKNPFPRQPCACTMSDGEHGKDCKGRWLRTLNSQGTCEWGGEAAAAARL